MYVSDVDMADIVRSILDGAVEHIISFDGRSQYSGDGGGVSACGLAALNCTRLVLQKDKSGIHGEDLLKDMMQREMFEVFVPFNVLFYSRTIAIGYLEHLHGLVEFRPSRRR